MLALLACATSAAVAATTTANVWVVPSGGSSSCARQATPVAYDSAPSSAKCSSVQAAVNAMSGGDVALMKTGTYASASVSGVTRSPAVTVKVESGGTATLTGGISFGSGANGVVLDGTQGANGKGFDTTDGASFGSNGGSLTQNVKLSGVTIHDGDGGQMIWMVGCSNVTVSHVEIAHIAHADGIQMAKYNGQPECSNVTFDDIYMHDFNADCGVDHQDGIQIRAGSNITFTNSKIVDLKNCGSQGFFANQEGDLGGSNTTLSNTVISGINGNAINFSSKPPQRMINNTIDGGLNTCQPVTSTCTGVIMKNNILNSACAGQKIFHDRVQNSADWANNISSSNCGYASQGDMVVSNLTSMFVSPASPSYDFHLKAGTAAIGKATTAEYTPSDMDGFARDGAPDVGADEYGNSGTTPPPADTTAPSTTIGSGPSGTTTATTASFAFTGSDDTTPAGSLTFECKLDTGSWGACTSPKSYTSLAVGSHTFSVRATDGAGNVDASPATQTWTVSSPPPADTTAPDTTIASGPVDGTSSSSASFSFSGSDDTTAAGALTFECSLDGAVFSACSSPKAYSGLAVGSHTFQVRARDAAGNADASPAAQTWTIASPAPVDTTAPTTTITGAPSGSTTATTASIAFTGSDNVTPAGSLTFQCKLDGGSYGACTSPKGYTGLSVGSHTVSVRATDAAGNTGAADTATWTVASTPPADTTAPSTTITSKPGDDTTATSVSFGFTGSDDTTAAGALTFQCKLDSGSYAACTSPKAYTVTVGTHTFSVRARDAAGNVDASPASYTWHVIAPDATAPQTTITSGPPALATDGDATFAFAGSDDRTSADALAFECSLDGAPYAACTSPLTYRGLALLGHTFSVRAVDAAGNVDASPATQSWTVLLPSLPDAGTPDTSTPDAGTPDPPAATTPDPGTTDPGTTDPAPAPSVTQVALSAPIAGSTFGRTLSMAAAATPADGATVKRVEFWLDGVRVAKDLAAPYKASYSVPAKLPAGLHTLSVRAVDSAGGVASSAVTVLHTTATGTTAKARRAAAKRLAAGSVVQLATMPAADGGTDLVGAAKADTVTATLAPCSGAKAKGTQKVRLSSSEGRVEAHRSGRLCVVGLSA